MRFLPTEIADVIEIIPRQFADERGFFMETYRQDRFAQAGIAGTFAQDNTSYSKKGVLRGLHLQLPPHAQSKLVMVGQGRIFDVAVDLRRGSSTFGKWVGRHLDSVDGHGLYIPQGFLHGFYVMSDTATVHYKCTAMYHPASERSLRWDDPQLAIRWPLIGPPIVAEKDLRAPTLAGCDFLDHV